MHIRSFRALAVSLLVLGAVARPSQASAQVDVTFLSFGQEVYRNGVYVGPYTMALPGTPSVDIFCVDFINDVLSVPMTYSAYISRLDGSLANTRLGDAGRALYQRAAWLTTQFASHAQSEWGAIHAAIWYITTPNPETNPYAYGYLQMANWNHWEWYGSTKVADWINLAESNYQSIALDRYSVITDVNAAGVSGYQGMQEFIVVTPEPISLLLVGTGLAGTFAAERKRRRRGGSDPVANPIA